LLSNAECNGHCCSFSKLSQEEPPSLEECAKEFRQVLCDEIAKLWPHKKAKAQEVSDLLDQGNRLLIAYDRSGGVATSSAPSKAKREHDAFWDLPPSQWQSLLVLQAERGSGPATLHAEGSGRRRWAPPSNNYYLPVPMFAMIPPSTSILIALRPPLVWQNGL
jgi:hypothetical protein